MKYALVTPRYYWALFKELTAFVGPPDTSEAAEKTTRRRICDTVGLFVIKLLVLIPVGVIMSVIYDPENLTSQSMAERFSPVQLLLVAGLILPLVEEVGFRLSLRFRQNVAKASCSALICTTSPSRRRLLCLMFRLKFRQTRKTTTRLKTSSCWPKATCGACRQAAFHSKIGWPRSSVI